MILFHWTRFLKVKKVSNLFVAPPPPEVLSRVGSEEGGVQECAGSPLLRRFCLLGSNLPRSLTNKHALHTRTHTNRLYEEVKGHSHPAGCSLSVLLSVLSHTLLAFNAAYTYDIHKHPPQFSQSFYMPWRTLLDLTCITTITCAPGLRHIVELWRKLGGNEQHILFPRKKESSLSNHWLLTNTPRWLLHISLLSFLCFLHPLLFIDLIYGFC